MNKNVLGLLKEQIEKEPFANYMGIKLLDIASGYAVMEGKFSEKMKNFNGLIHGGAIVALIDEAFAAASNSHDTIAYALNINVTFLQAPKAGSVLISEAREESRTEHTATYRIEVLEKGENGDRIIAFCRALDYRKDRNLAFLEKEMKTE